MASVGLGPPLGHHSRTTTVRRSVFYAPATPYRPFHGKSFRLESFRLRFLGDEDLPGAMARPLTHNQSRTRFGVN